MSINFENPEIQSILQNNAIEQHYSLDCMPTKLVDPSTDKANRCLYEKLDPSNYESGLFCKMDCISGFSKFIDIVSKLFSTRGYLKPYLTRLISVENRIFLSQFSEDVRNRTTLLVRLHADKTCWPQYRQGKSLFV
jgi:hypothetical protein